MRAGLLLDALHIYCGHQINFVEALKLRRKNAAVGRRGLVLGCHRSTIFSWKTMGTSIVSYMRTAGKNHNVKFFEEF